MGLIAIVCLIITSSVILFDPIQSETVINDVESTEVPQQDIHIEINVHGVDGNILDVAINVVIGVFRQALKIIKPISPHVYAALDDILQQIIGAVQGLSINNHHMLIDLIERLINIVADGIKVVEGLLIDAAVLADGILHGAVALVLTGLKAFSAALKLFLPVVKVAGGLFGGVMTVLG